MTAPFLAHDRATLTNIAPSLTGGQKNSLKALNRLVHYRCRHGWRQRGETKFIRELGVEQEVR